MKQPADLAEFQNLYGPLTHRERSIAKIATAVEREECAAIADAVAADKRGHDFDGIRKGCAQGIAEAIRERK
jgi:hypothetical protein